MGLDLDNHEEVEAELMNMVHERENEVRKWKERCAQSEEEKKIMMTTLKQHVSRLCDEREVIMKHHEDMKQELDECRMQTVHVRNANNALIEESRDYKHVLQQHTLKEEQMQMDMELLQKAVTEMGTQKKTLQKQLSETFERMQVCVDEKNSVTEQLRNVQMTLNEMVLQKAQLQSALIVANKKKQVCVCVCFLGGCLLLCLMILIRIRIRVIRMHKFIYDIGLCVCVCVCCCCC